jgi:translation initiation factor IF-2
VAGEFGYEIENVVLTEEAILGREEDRPEDLVARPPVVTVMGHVDHGKTSLLDAIRQTRVAAGESGGITQHIGAYKVETSRGTVVFLDTPGHAAFTEMRARGAKVTDIVVLVVAANDGVMPQTIEAIHHARAANVPIIVALNKIDLPDANPDRVKRELAEQGLAPEDWGGEVICVPVSAKKGIGIDQLLEMIALQAEIMQLTANPGKLASGIVVEARLDRGRGPVATVLVQEGTLSLGDVVLSGSNYGRVRTLTNDTGKREKKITPGFPVEITGLDGVPQAGSIFMVVENERVAKEISSRRQEKTREAEMLHARHVSLEDLHEKIAEGAIKSLRLIVKADVQGSVEALAQTFEKLVHEEVKINVIHKGVGGITESDVNLAIASDAIIVGFHVRAESKASQLAERSGVDIRLYDVIYAATDDVKLAMSGMLAPRTQEKILGRVQIREIFRVPKVGVVAGCMVTKGIVTRAAKLRLIRDNVVVYEGMLSSLRRFKDDVREVREGFECGLSIEGYNDIKVGDEVEFYQIEEIAQTM